MPIERSRTKQSQSAVLSLMLGFMHRGIVRCCEQPDPFPYWFFDGNDSIEGTDSLVELPPSMTLVFEHEDTAGRYDICTPNETWWKSLAHDLPELAELFGTREQARVHLLTEVERDKQTMRALSLVGVSRAQLGAEYDLLIADLNGSAIQNTVEASLAHEFVSRNLQVAAALVHQQLPPTGHWTAKLQTMASSVRH